MRNFRKILFLMIIFMFSFMFGGSNLLKVLAAEAEEKPIYYEEEVLETNELPGGVSHKRVKGFSMVTNNSPDMILPSAKEAGSANQIPIEFNR